MWRENGKQAGWAGSTARRPPAVMAVDTPPGGFALLLPALVDAIPESRHRFRAWLRGHHVDPELIADVLLVAGELVANSIEHAFGPGEAGEVRFCARTGDGVLTIQVDDTGAWRPPRSGPSTRGRGLVIVRAIADSVEIDRRCTGTRITAVIRTRRDPA
ncbi:ATP-binding protein [Actinokineospora guangxiensis]|uniref:ATP-binding protein n=1 Tax=Actinokineospora guangxiensis TaxID=1490288 RepID=A0ABW0EQN6_9PSEU